MSLEEALAGGTGAGSMGLLGRMGLIGLAIPMTAFAQTNAGPDDDIDDIRPPYFYHGSWISLWWLPLVVLALVILAVMR